MTTSRVNKDAIFPECLFAKSSNVMGGNEDLQEREVKSGCSGNNR